MRKDEPKKCIHCGTSLPYRYKGRQRIYCSDLCRKSYKKEQYYKCVHIYIDGGTRNSNICLVNKDTSECIVKYRRGNPTNNELEYLALLYALEYVGSKFPDKYVRIYSDSKLIVNQINGKWRVTTETLRPLYVKCKPMMNEKIKLVWISRKFNLAGHVLEKQISQGMFHVLTHHFYLFD